ncbi:MAG: MOSC domain-containing protein [Rhodothermaceae bacterium]
MHTNKIEITELNIYPVKSLKGISLNESKLTIEGLEHDRRWMLTDEDYNFITQRQITEMAKIKVALNKDFLVLEAEGISPLEVELNSKEDKTIDTAVWDSDCKGIDQGDNASRWLTETLGKFNFKNLRLVKFPNGFIRNVSPKYLQGENAKTAFADGYPFLITLEESLSFLNSRLEENGNAQVDMKRFRANIVLKNLAPFDEHIIETLGSEKGEYSFGLRKPCRRCKIITINQENGQIKDPSEPLATLAQINQIKEKKGSFFGQNSTLLKGENNIIRVGDKLTII